MVTKSKHLIDQMLRHADAVTIVDSLCEVDLLEVAPHGGSNVGALKADITKLVGAKAMRNKEFWVTDSLTVYGIDDTIKQLHSKLSKTWPLSPLKQSSNGLNFFKVK